MFDYSSEELPLSKPLNLGFGVYCLPPSTGCVSWRAFVWAGVSGNNKLDVLIGSGAIIAGH